MQKFIIDETVEEMLSDMIVFRCIEQYATLDRIFKEWKDMSYLEAGDIMAFRGETIQGLYEAQMLTPEQIKEIARLDAIYIAGNYPNEGDIYEFIQWLKKHKLEV